MKSLLSSGWLAGAVFVLLLIDAYGLWGVNSVVSIINLVAAGLILIFSFVSGYSKSSQAR